MAQGFKTGGRVAGTPNRKTADVAALLEGLGCSPLESMAKIADDENVDVAIRLSALKDLASYLYPKRKAIELDASVSVLSHEAALAYLEADV
jgi:hypothetical protein